jgi:hypothetical protein
VDQQGMSRQTENRRQGAALLGWGWRHSLTYTFHT